MIATVVAIIGGTVWTSGRTPERNVPTTNGPAGGVVATSTLTPLHTDFELEPKTLDELLAIPIGELHKVDIARMNLLCAAGLPGAEQLDVEHALATLDQWAGYVRDETDRHLYRVNDPRYADHYHHSEAYFRAEFLLQILQQDLGVKYDMSAADNFAFDDSRVAFLHGMIPAPGADIADTPGGTCASMPVMYVAIGRRLGYPLKLVTTKAHIFARWDGEDHPNPKYRERFNIEGAGEGFSSFPDEHYTQGRFATSPHIVQAHRYMLSLSPAEEFAEFLATRGHCGMDHGQYGFAARCYENAYRYDTTQALFREWFLNAASRCDYRPVTPALAQAIEQRRHAIATMAIRPMLDGIPSPSQTQAAMERAMPDAPSLGRWQTPRPWTSGLPQPSLAQPLDHNDQTPPFRSQP